MRKRITMLVLALLCAGTTACTTLPCDVGVGCTRSIPKGEELRPIP